MPPTIKKPTLSRYESLYSKVVASNLSIYEIQRLSIREYNQALGTKIKKKTSLKGQHRLLNQIRDNIKPVEKLYLKKRKITYSKSVVRTKRKSDSLFDTERGKIQREKEIEYEVDEPEYEVEEPKKEVDLPSKIPKPTTKSEYGTFEIYNEKTDEYYYIKYRSVKEFKNRLRKLKDSIGKKLKYNFLGMNYYKTFIDKEFESFVQKTLGAR